MRRSDTVGIVALIKFRKRLLFGRAVFHCRDQGILCVVTFVELLVVRGHTFSPSLECILIDADVRFCEGIARLGAGDCRFHTHGDLFKAAASLFF